MAEVALYRPAPYRAIRLAGIVTFIASLQLITFNSYLVVFLERDLFIAVLIISLIVSSRNFLQIFFRIPFGELSQIIGRKPLIVFGHFCLTAASFLLAFSTSWILPFIATMAIAVGMSSFWPPMLSFLSDVTPNNMGESNGKIFALWDIGIILISLMAKVLLDFVGISLQELFLLVGVVGIFSGFVVIFILPESLTKNKKRVASIPKAFIGSIVSTFVSLYTITRLKGISEVFSFQLVLAFLSFMIQTFFPLLVVYRGFTKGTVSEIYFWATLVLLWFKPHFGRITDRFRFSSVITVLLLVSAVFSLVITVVTELWLIIITYIILSACFATGFVATNGETARKSPEIYRGTALGALGVWLSIGRTTSTMTLGIVWEVLDLEAVFHVTAIGVIIITPILYLLFKLKDRKNEAEQVSF
ncbi:MAG: MFS transporter [Promethearchaeota archaeon]